MRNGCYHVMNRKVLTSTMACNVHRPEKRFNENTALFSELSKYVESINLGFGYLAVSFNTNL